MREEIIQWLTEFQESVSSRDYARGEELFAPNSVCFGSKATMLSNRKDLVENQWKHIWGNITEFRFDLSSLEIFESTDSNMVCALCLWNSIGYHKDGKAYDRPGRVTFALQRTGDSQWLALHSHYSLVPGTPLETELSHHQ